MGRHSGRMKFAAAFLLFLLAMPASAAERRYTLTDFDRIQVDGPYRVTVAVGGTGGAVGIGDLAALDRVSVDAEGRTLRIRTVRSKWTGNGAAGPVEIRVTTRSLRALAVTGSALVAVTGAKGLRFDLSLSGSARVDLKNVAADRLVVGLIGAGSATIAGSAKLFEAAVQGSASLDAAALQAEDVQIASASAGTIQAAARRKASIVNHGSGDIIVGGTAACTVKSEGAGLVRCG
jgi:hypothetical protein